jgi:hypothetical protein
MTSSHPREHADKHRLRGEISVGTRGCLRLQSDNSGMAQADIESTPKGDAWKLEIALALRTQTTASKPWIAKRLNMGPPSRISKAMQG